MDILNSEGNLSNSLTERSTKNKTYHFNLSVILKINSTSIVKHNLRVREKGTKC